MRSPTGRNRSSSSKSRTESSCAWPYWRSCSAIVEKSAAVAAPTFECRAAFVGAATAAISSTPCPRMKQEIEMHAAVHAGRFVDAPPGEHDRGRVGEILGAAVAMQDADAAVPLRKPLEKIERRLAGRALDRPRMKLADHERLETLDRPREAAQRARLHAGDVDLDEIEPVEIAERVVEHD